MSAQKCCRVNNRLIHWILKKYKWLWTDVFNRQSPEMSCKHTLFSIAIVSIWLRIKYIWFFMLYSISELISIWRWMSYLHSLEIRPYFISIHWCTWLLRGDWERSLFGIVWDVPNCSLIYTIKGGKCYAAKWYWDKWFEKRIYNGTSPNLCCIISMWPLCHQY